jgi:hypothetical protein
MPGEVLTLTQPAARQCLSGGQAAGHRDAPVPAAPTVGDPRPLAITRQTHANNEEQEPAHQLKGRIRMSQTAGVPRTPTRPPHQPMRFLWAYLGLTFALAWAAWVPAAVLFRDPHRPGLPSFTSGLVVLQTLLGRVRNVDSVRV